MPDVGIDMMSWRRWQFEHSKMYHLVHSMIIFTTNSQHWRFFILYLNQRKSFEKLNLIQRFCFVLKKGKKKEHKSMS